MLAKYTGVGEGVSAGVDAGVWLGDGNTPHNSMLYGVAVTL